MIGKKIAVIPAYKPDSKLTDVVRQLSASGFSVVVVDDGSGSGYSDLFAETECYAEVLTHKLNRGKGEALKTGFRYVKEHFEPPYTVVTADADGQHAFDDIVRVSAAAEKDPEALVLGSRKFEGKVPLRSLFGNSVTRLVYRLASGIRVSDTQTGLRGFSDRLTDIMTGISGSRYEYEMNVLMELPRQGIPVTEIPIETVYIDGNRSSHFNTVKDSYRIYKEILKFSAASFASFLIDYGLYCLLTFLTGFTVFPNITARIVSSIFNFNLNKRMVFRSKEKTSVSAVKYFLLAAAILICNTLLLKLLTVIGLNRFIAKIFVECILFAVSYIVQHRYIFGRERASA